MPAKLGGVAKSIEYLKNNWCFQLSGNDLNLLQIIFLLKLMKDSQRKKKNIVSGALLTVYLISTR